MAVAGAAAADENWPQWRGPNLNGAVEASNLPVKWTETENIVWRVALPAWSGSTPIIWGDRIYLTSPGKGEHPVDANLGGGRRRRVRDPGGDSINLMCLNREDGSLIWKSEIGKGNRFQMKQNMASPSPVTDGERLWVMTGNGEFVCFDMDGKEIWRRNIQLEDGSAVAVGFTADMAGVDLSVTGSDDGAVAAACEIRGADAVAGEASTRQDSGMGSGSRVAGAIASSLRGAGLIEEGSIGGGARSALCSARFSATGWRREGADSRRGGGTGSSRSGLDGSAIRDGASAAAIAAAGAGALAGAAITRIPSHTSAAAPVAARRQASQSVLRRPELPGWGSATSS